MHSTCNIRISRVYWCDYVQGLVKLCSQSSATKWYHAGVRIGQNTPPPCPLLSRPPSLRTSFMDDPLTDCKIWTTFIANEQFDSGVFRLFGFQCSCCQEKLWTFTANIRLHIVVTTKVCLEITFDVEFLLTNMTREPRSLDVYRSVQLCTRSCYIFRSAPVVINYHLLFDRCWRALLVQMSVLDDNDEVYSQLNADIYSKKKQNTILLNDRQRNRHASKWDKWRRLGLYANEEQTTKITCTGKQQSIDRFKHTRKLTKYHVSALRTIL